MAKGHRSGWLYAAALVALAACLWVGWADFDPYVPQDVVRGSIHSLPRQAVQVVVQFIAPALIVAFLVGEAVARVRGRRSVAKP